MSTATRATGLTILRTPVNTSTRAADAMISRTSALAIPRASELQISRTLVLASTRSMEHRRSTARGLWLTGYLGTSAVGPADVNRYRRAVSSCFPAVREQMRRVRRAGRGRGAMSFGVSSDVEHARFGDDERRTSRRISGRSVRPRSLRCGSHGRTRIAQRPRYDRNGETKGKDRAGATGCDGTRFTET
jgi:hypothetical protein